MYWRGGSWQNYELGGVNGDGKVLDMTTRVGSERRVEEMIIASEKSVYWMNHPGPEVRNRNGNSEPETMALMNGRE